MSDSKRITVCKQNEVYSLIKLDGFEEGNFLDLINYFSFYVPGYRHMQKFKVGFWDGKIRLFTPGKPFLNGLLYRLEEYAFSNQYEFKWQGVPTRNLFLPTLLDDLSLKSYLADLNPSSLVQGKRILYKVEDFRYEAVKHALSQRRAILLLPPSSGKSLIQACIVRYLQEFCLEEDEKILCIFPRTNLVDQIYGDFVDYFTLSSTPYDMVKNCHKIYAGADKASEKQVYFSTWQSLMNMNQDYFEQFGALIIDECQASKAEQLNNIGKKCINARYRIGLTGTLQSAQAHSLVIESILGKPRTFITTKELMDRKESSQAKFHCIELQYPSEIKEKYKARMKYPDEMKFLHSFGPRNNFLVSLALQLSTSSGNTLLLFRIIKHGERLHKLICEKLKAQGKDCRNVYFISGKIKTDFRNQVRAIVEGESDAIIVATIGTFAEGINIRRLFNLIIGTPIKGEIPIKQSLGRVFRLSDDKECANIYDIGDNLKYKSRANHALRHFEIRQSLYYQEQFDISKYKVNLKNGELEF